MVVTIGGYFFARNNATLPKQQIQLQHNIQQEANKMTAFVEELDYNVDSAAFAKIHFELPFQSYYFDNQNLKLWNTYQNSLSTTDLQKVMSIQGFQLLNTNHQWYLTYHLERNATNNIVLAQSIVIPPARDTGRAPRRAARVPTSAAPRPGTARCFMQCEASRTAALSG